MDSTLVTAYSFIQQHLHLFYMSGSQTQTLKDAT